MIKEAVRFPDSFFSKVRKGIGFMKFFSIESGFYKFMNRVLEFLKISLLWLLCSLPVVTMGAATVAAYTITLKMVDEEEGYIAKPFFKAFRENLLQGSLLGIITMVGAYAIYLDFQLFEAVEDNPVIFLIVGMVGIFLLVMGTVFAFPLLARYENTIPRTMRNSYRIATRCFVRTLLMVVILAVELVFFFWNTTTIVIGVLLGPASMIYTISAFALIFFREIEKEPGTVKKETE
mgnify:FL=1